MSDHGGLDSRKLVDHLHLQECARTPAMYSPAVFMGFYHAPLGALWRTATLSIPFPSSFPFLVV